MDLSILREKIKDKLIWDYNLKEEFKDRRVGFAFAIDAWENPPKLALYTIKLNGTMGDILPVQPPDEMLVKALEEQGVKPGQGEYHAINTEIRRWIEENIL